MQELSAQSKKIAAKCYQMQLFCFFSDASGQAFVRL